MIEERNNLFMFNNLYNVRHLGGIVTKDNHILKDYKYIRGSAKGELTEKEKAHLYNRGVRIIVDLRYTHEITKTLSPLKDYKDTSYYHVDMMGEFWQMREKGYTDLSDLYIDLLDDSQQKIYDVLQIFLKHVNEGIYFHCTAGKDRTGIITMLLLELVGVDDATIISNYSESYENNKARPGYKNMPEEWRRFTYSHPEYMERTLAYFRKHYKDAASYLRLIGLTEQEIELLKSSIIK